MKPVTVMSPSVPMFAIIGTSLDQPAFATSFISAVESPVRIVFAPILRVLSIQYVFGPLRYTVPPPILSIYASALLSST